MVKLTKIYTRTGDDGSTALIGGDRIGKGELRLEVYGTIDEVNAWCGMLRTGALASDDAEIAADAETTFATIQRDLFDIGSLDAEPVRPGEHFLDVVGSKAGLDGLVEL